jgi:hypothetical protein
MLLKETKEDMEGDILDIIWEEETEPEEDGD